MCNLLNFDFLTTLCNVIACYVYTPLDVTGEKSNPTDQVMALWNTTSARIPYISSIDLHAPKMHKI